MKIGSSWKAMAVVLLALGRVTLGIYENYGTCLGKEWIIPAKQTALSSDKLFGRLTCVTSKNAWDPSEKCDDRCYNSLPKCEETVPIYYPNWERPPMMVACRIVPTNGTIMYRGFNTTLPMNKQQCTVADIETQMNAKLSFHEQVLFIYQNLMLRCAIVFCPEDNYMPLNAVPCYVNHSSTPSVMGVRTLPDKEWCKPYSMSVENCKILPACAGHPIMEELGIMQMPFVKISNGVPELQCEHLCSDGEANWNGMEHSGSACRRLYSSKTANPVNGYWFVKNGFCSEELSQRKNFTLDCNKRPVCSGIPPEPYGPENPFGSDTCAPLKENCRQHDVENYYCNPKSVIGLHDCPDTMSIKLRPKPSEECNILPMCNKDRVIKCITGLEHCSKFEASFLKCTGELRQAKIKICDTYTNDSSDCELLPLCLDTLRATAYSECEELCLSHNQTRCREIPGRWLMDKFNVLSRLRSIAATTEVDSFFERLSAAAHETFRQATFEGLPVCSEEDSLSRSISGPLCSRIPFCEETYCVQKMTNCNENEQELFICANVIPPLCDKYEPDAELLVNKTCTPRLMCDDLRRMLLKVPAASLKLLQYYSLSECEEICPDDEFIDVFTEVIVAPTPERLLARRRRAEQGNEVSKSFRQSKQGRLCRTRPTRGHDPWKVAANDASRARPWCSAEESVRRAHVLGCNKLPICTEHSVPPKSYTLNPFYAVSSECVQPKSECTNEEAAEYHCASVSSGSASRIIIIIVCACVIIVIVGVVFAKMRKKKWPPAKRKPRTPKPQPRRSQISSTASSSAAY